MEPGYNAPRMNPEQAPALPQVSPEFSPDVNSGSSAEKTPTRPETESRPQPQQAAVPVADIAAPALPQAPVGVTQDDSLALVESMPATAADDDLIEKEWVSKAKRIISETADDPHRREAAVAQLQREYLRKRYGKEFGAS